MVERPAVNGKVAGSSPARGVFLRNPRLVVSLEINSFFRNAQVEQRGLNVVDHLDESANIKIFVFGIPDERFDVGLNVARLTGPGLGGAAEREKKFKVRMLFGQTFPFVFVENIVIVPVPKNEVNISVRVPVQKIQNHAPERSDAGPSGDKDEIVLDRFFEPESAQRAHGADFIPQLQLMDVAGGNPPIHQRDAQLKGIVFLWGGSDGIGCSPHFPSLRDKNLHVLTGIEGERGVLGHGKTNAFVPGRQ